MSENASFNPIGVGTTGPDPSWLLEGYLKPEEVDPDNIARQIRQKAEAQMRELAHFHEARYAELERQYSQVRKYYDERARGLDQTVRNAIEEIRSDPTMKVLSQDPNSHSHMTDRMTEVFLKFLSVDSETRLNNMTVDLGNKQLKISALEREVQSLKKSLAEARRANEQESVRFKQYYQSALGGRDKELHQAAMLVRDQMQLRNDLSRRYHAHSTAQDIAHRDELTKLHRELEQKHEREVAQLREELVHAEKAREACERLLQRTQQQMTNLTKQAGTWASDLVRKTGQDLGELSLDRNYKETFRTIRRLVQRDGIISPDSNLEFSSLLVTLEHKIIEADTMLSETSDALASARDERDELARKLNRVQGELIEIREEKLSTLIHEKQEVVNQLQQAEQLLAQSEKDRLDLRATYLSLRDKAEMLANSDKERVASTTAGLMTTIELQKAKIIELKKRISDEQVHYTQHHKDAKRQIKAMEDRVRKAEEAVTLARNEVAPLHMANAKLKARLEEEISLKESACRTLQQRQQEAQAELEHREQLWQEQKRRLEADVPDQVEHAISKTKVRYETVIEDYERRTKELKKEIVQAKDEAAKNSAQGLQGALEMLIDSKVQESFGGGTNSVRAATLSELGTVASNTATTEARKGLDAKLQELQKRLMTTEQHEALVVQKVQAAEAKAYASHAEALARYEKAAQQQLQLSLDQQARDYKSTLADAQATVERLQGELDTSKRALSKVQTELDEAVSRESALQVRSKQLVRDRESLVEIQEENENSLAKARDEVSSLKRQLEQAQSQVDAYIKLQGQFTTMQGELEILTSERESANKKAKHATERTNQAEAELEAERSRLEQELKQVQVDKETRLTELRANATHEQNKALAALRSEFEEELEVLSSSHKAELSSLKVKHQQAINAMEAAHNQALEDAKSAKSNELKRLSVAHDAAIKSLQGELARVNARLNEDAQAHENEVEALRSRHHDDLDKYKSQIEAFAQAEREALASRAQIEGEALATRARLEEVSARAERQKTEAETKAKVEAESRLQDELLVSQRKGQKEIADLLKELSTKDREIHTRDEMLKLRERELQDAENKFQTDLLASQRQAQEGVAEVLRELQSKDHELKRLEAELDSANSRAEAMSRAATDTVDQSIAELENQWQTEVSFLRVEKQKAVTQLQGEMRRTNSMGVELTSVSGERDHLSQELEETRAKLRTQDNLINELESRMQIDESTRAQLAEEIKTSLADEDARNKLLIDHLREATDSIDSLKEMLAFENEMRTKSELRGEQMSAANDRLRGDLEQVKMQLEHSQSQCHKLQAERDRAGRAVQQLRFASEEDLRKVSELSAQLEHEASRAESLSRQVAVMSEFLEESDKAKRKLVDANSQLQSEIEQLQFQLQHPGNHSTDDTSGDSGQLLGLGPETYSPVHHARLSAANRRNELLQSRLEAETKRADALSRQVREEKAQLAILCTRIDVVQEQQAFLEDKVRNERRMRELIEEQLDDERMMRRQVETRWEHHQSSLMNYSHSAAASKIDSPTPGLHSPLATETGNATPSALRVQQLSKDLKHRERIAAETENLLTDARSKCEQLKNERDQERKRRLQVTEDSEVQQAQLAQANARLGSLEHETRLQKVSLEELESVLTELKSEHKNARSLLYTVAGQLAKECNRLNPDSPLKAMGAPSDQELHRTIQLRLVTLGDLVSDTLDRLQSIQEDTTKKAKIQWSDELNTRFEHLSALRNLRDRVSMLKDSLVLVKSSVSQETSGALMDVQKSISEFIRHQRLDGSRAQEVYEAQRAELKRAFEAEQAKLRVEYEKLMEDRERVLKEVHEREVNDLTFKLEQSMRVNQTSSSGSDDDSGVHLLDAVVDLLVSHCGVKAETAHALRHHHEGAETALLHDLQTLSRQAIDTKRKLNESHSSAHEANRALRAAESEIASLKRHEQSMPRPQPTPSQSSQPEARAPPSTARSVRFSPAPARSRGSPAMSRFLSSSPRPDRENHSPIRGPRTPFASVVASPSASVLYPPSGGPARTLALPSPTKVASSPEVPTIGSRFELTIKDLQREIETEASRASRLRSQMQEKEERYGRKLGDTERELQEVTRELASRDAALRASELRLSNLENTLSRSVHEMSLKDRQNVSAISGLQAIIDQSYDSMTLDAVEAAARLESRTRELNESIRQIREGK